jgi:hypothetical protein
MKVNITVVATKTFTAGFVPSGAVAMLQIDSGTALMRNPLKIAQGGPAKRSKPECAAALF